MKKYNSFQVEIETLTRFTIATYTDIDTSTVSNDILSEIPCEMFHKISSYSQYPNVNITSIVIYGAVN